MYIINTIKEKTRFSECHPKKLSEGWNSSINYYWI